VGLAEKLVSFGLLNLFLYKISVISPHLLYDPLISVNRQAAGSNSIWPSITLNGRPSSNFDVLIFKISEYPAEILVYDENRYRSHRRTDIFQC